MVTTGFRRGPVWRQLNGGGNATRVNEPSAGALTPALYSSPKKINQLDYQAPAARESREYMSLNRAKRLIDSSNFISRAKSRARESTTSVRVNRPSCFVSSLFSMQSLRSRISQKFSRNTWSGGTARSWSAASQVTSRSSLRSRRGSGRTERCIFRRILLSARVLQGFDSIQAYLDTPHGKSVPSC